MGKIKNFIKALVNKLPYIRALYQKGLNTYYPNGHFYSPVISIEEIKKREPEIWKDIEPDEIPGIALNAEEQKSLAQQFEQYYAEIPFKAEKQAGIRYYFENDAYSYTDAIILYSMIRHFKPERIIEIGCGFSSAVMLDTNERFFNNAINITCIEPYPERLYSLITDEDRATLTIIDKGGQTIDLSLFEAPEKGDILFVDTTHVVKTGSDVNFILFEVLPVLKPGVLIHFHDVFYPFEYVKGWVFSGFNWNDDYFLRAFLMYNTQFTIKFFADYIHKKHKACFEPMPLAFKNTGGNLWIEKQA
jgi:predicted O-methyltransferase YrrM